MDVIEQAATDRVKELFGAGFADVHHSGGLYDVAAYQVRRSDMRSRWTSLTVATR